MKNVGIFALGLVCGAALLLLLTVLTSRFTPPTPHLKQPKTITVFLHPWSEYRAATNIPVIIPAKNQESVFRRLVPETYYGDINEHITPIVAHATITHSDETQTHVLVREGGKNPAVVSVDGKNYFYARNESDVFAGATELISLVSEIYHQRQTEPTTE